MMIYSFSDKSLYKVSTLVYTSFREALKGSTLAKIAPNLMELSSQVANGPATVDALLIF